VEAVLAIVVGILYAGGLYLVMRRSIVKLILGLGLLGHATNLLIFTVGGLTRARAPMIPEGGEIVGAVANPLPQALILTAIVIGFGVQAFTLVLVHRAIQTVGKDDLDAMKSTDT